MDSSLVMQLMFVGNICSSKYRIHKYRKFFVHLRKIVIQEMFLGANSPSLAKAFNKFSCVWIDKSIQQNNPAQLFKEPTKRSAELLIKILGDENAICFPVCCWTFSWDFFLCPTIQGIRDLCQITLPAFPLLRWLFGQMNSVSVLNEVVSLDLF